MKKNASEDSAAGSLHQTFWRWISLSVFALVVAAAFQARSADVFIDEGDGDYAATPVSSPSASGGKAPASEADVPPANPGSDLDAPPLDLEPAPGNSSASDLGVPVDSVPVQKAPIGEAPIEKSKSTKSKSAKKEKKSSKKSSKSSKKKEKKSSKKSSKKDAKKSSKKPKKKTHSASTGTASSKAGKRKVASFFGGEYATTKKACTMESAPGAGDSVGTTAKDRKLWVEDSGNTSYWKVYGKSGAAAFVSRDCF